MVKKMCLVAVLAVVIFSFVGCQTIEGVGRDVEWICEKTAETAESLQ